MPGVMTIIQVQVSFVVIPAIIWPQRCSLEYPERMNEL